MVSARVMLPLAPVPPREFSTTAILYPYARLSIAGVILAFVYKMPFIIDSNRHDCPSGTAVCPYGVQIGPRSHMLTVKLAPFGEFWLT